ncbi:MAG: Ldh family oxidoreductase [Candidatus Latescibacteria bacterium]|nr:Ldh family oxidoreductase [Candidatus Latescibacterota bacterium]
MPRFSPENLQQLGYAIFEKCGCSPEDARTVVDHLVESSLFGHDSHGIIRLYEYVPFMREGVFDPKGVPRIVDERPCTAVVDGGGAMGQVGAAFATQLGLDKARQHGIASITLRNTSHVGRVGAYPLRIAREGMIGVMYVNAGRLGRQITPYGGIDGKLSTNPIAFAAPRRQADPVMVDMATSMSAEGKIRVASNRGLPVPEGFLIDHQGNPTTDPAGFLGDPPGAILPLGGTAAHKGYCLGMLVEILGGALSGEGVANGARDMTSNGVLLTVYNIEHFTSMESFYDEVETLVQHVHTSRIDPRVGEILIPGEPEFRSAQERRRTGIEIDDTTWGHICREARGLGLDPDAWEAM